MLTLNIINAKLLVLFTVSGTFYENYPSYNQFRAAIVMIGFLFVILLMIKFYYRSVKINSTLIDRCLLIDAIFVFFTIKFGWLSRSVDTRAYWSGIFDVATHWKRVIGSSVGSFGLESSVYMKDYAVDFFSEVDLFGCFGILLLLPLLLYVSVFLIGSIYCEVKGNTDLTLKLMNYCSFLLLFFVWSGANSRSVVILFDLVDQGFLLNWLVGLNFKLSSSALVLFAVLMHSITFYDLFINLQKSSSSTKILAMAQNSINNTTVQRLPQRLFSICVIAGIFTTYSSIGDQWSLIKSVVMLAGVVVALTTFFSEIFILPSHFNVFKHFLSMLGWGRIKEPIADGATITTRGRCLSRPLSSGILSSAVSEKPAMAKVCSITADPAGTTAVTKEELAEIDERNKIFKKALDSESSDIATTQGVTPIRLDLELSKGRGFDVITKVAKDEESCSDKIARLSDEVTQLRIQMDERERSRDDKAQSNRITDAAVGAAVTAVVLVLDQEYPDGKKKIYTSAKEGVIGVLKSVDSAHTSEGSSAKLS